MKRLLLLSAAMVMFAVGIPLYAADMTPEKKNDCLLISKGCMSEVDTLQQKMRKLDAEIKKGNRVYTPQELERLRSKLKEANDLLDDLTTKGG